jgi:hypothetical protein
VYETLYIFVGRHHDILIPRFTQKRKLSMHGRGTTNLLPASNNLHIVRSMHVDSQKKIMLCFVQFHGVTIAVFVLFLPA